MDFQDEVIQFRHLPVLGLISNRKVSKKTEKKEVSNESFESLKEATASFEKKYIERLLKSKDQNRSETAKILGISERSLYYKIKKYNIKT